MAIINLSGRIEITSELKNDTITIKFTSNESAKLVEAILKQTLIEVKKEQADIDTILSIKNNEEAEAEIIINTSSDGRGETFLRIFSNNVEDDVSLLFNAQYIKGDSAWKIFIDIDDIKKRIDDPIIDLIIQEAMKDKKTVYIAQ